MHLVGKHRHRAALLEDLPHAAPRLHADEVVGQECQFGRTTEVGRKLRIVMLLGDARL